MTGPQVTHLGDGRLHLNHGPIDLIITAEGPDRVCAFEAAIDRFSGMLEGLAADLDSLRKPLKSRRKTTSSLHLREPTANRMIRAVRPFSGTFVTPMAAVAGAVADEIVASMTRHRLTRVIVNNGGDIAFHLAQGQTLSVASPSGLIDVDADDPARGLATSGWRGRSHSLGIADAVTVLARSAAEADVAATILANAVDLPGHPAVTRTPANLLSPDSDLGQRPVTTAVGPLGDADVTRALNAGVERATAFLDRNLILAATLKLGTQTHIAMKEHAHA